MLKPVLAAQVPWPATGQFTAKNVIQEYRSKFPWSGVPRESGRNHGAGIVNDGGHRRKGVSVVEVCHCAQALDGEGLVRGLGVSCQGRAATSRRIAATVNLRIRRIILRRKLMQWKE